MRRRRHDVAIYSPGSCLYFEDGGVSGEKRPFRGGGAELQMALLAMGLARNDLQVAIVVFPVHRQRPLSQPLPELVERTSYVGDRPLIGRLSEAVEVWRAMRQADAAVYVFRGGRPSVLAAAAFAMLRRRKLVFSAANDLDFNFRRHDQPAWSRLLSRVWLKGVDVTVTQRRQQLELAEKAGITPLALVPSFAEPAEPVSEDADAMLWVGRLADYKRPLIFVKLAESLPEIRFRMAYLPIDRELTEQVESMAARIPNLELLQTLPRPQLMKELKRTMALVSTSQWEGMPNVFLEAWARSIPVISFEYDPDGLILADDLGVVAGGSTERLAELTEALWGDPERRVVLGRNGRDYVQRVHSPQVVAAQWADLIRDLETRHNDGV
jgi:glycosyltransferase involved in cell wall biosynthesis